MIICFYLSFVNVVYYIKWFADVESSLYLWNKSHLIMVSDPFNLFFKFCLLIFCWGFFHLSSSRILVCNFLFSVSLFGLGIRVCRPCRMNLEVLLMFFRIWEGLLLARRMYFKWLHIIEKSLCKYTYINHTQRQRGVYMSHIYIKYYTTASRIWPLIFYSFHWLNF